MVVGVVGVPVLTDFLLLLWQSVCLDLTKRSRDGPDPEPQSHLFALLKHQQPNIGMAGVSDDTTGRDTEART